MGVGSFGPSPSEAVRPLRGRFRRRRPTSRSRRQRLHIARGPQRMTAGDQSAGNTERRDHTPRAQTPQTSSPVAGTLTISGRRHVAHDTCSAPSPRASAHAAANQHHKRPGPAPAPLLGKKTTSPRGPRRRHVLSPPANGRKRRASLLPPPSAPEPIGRGVCARAGGEGVRSEAGGPARRSRGPGGGRSARSACGRRVDPSRPARAPASPPSALLGFRAAAAVPPLPPALAPGDPAMPVRTECPPPAGASAASAASLIPPPPINTQQPGVATSLLYSGSKFRGHQKSKGNSYDVEVVLQVSQRPGLSRRPRTGPRRRPLGPSATDGPAAWACRGPSGAPQPCGPQPGTGRLRSGPASPWPVAPATVLFPVPLGPRPGNSPGIPSDSGLFQARDVPAASHVFLGPMKPRPWGPPPPPGVSSSAELHPSLPSISPGT